MLVFRSQFQIVLEVQKERVTYSMNAMKLEQELLLLAVLKSRTAEENSRLQEISGNKLDWGWIGGQLLHHRLSGYFYFGLGELRKQLLFKEFLIALELIVKAQSQQIRELNQLVRPVLQEFEERGLHYAALKGLVFNANLYNLGERRSNDSDILVWENDLDMLDEILRKHGYIQTYMHNGEYKEATRKEKMIQRMNYHDLVPYVKIVDSPFLSKHEIDINFHFDSKDNDITKAVLEYGTQIYAGELLEVRGLQWETHMAQLCIHFYREGTSSIWSSGRRDVVLYKLIDVANTLRFVQDEQRLMDWAGKLKEWKLDKASYYTLYYIEQFYPNVVPEKLMSALRPEDIGYLDEIAISGHNNIIKRQVAFRDDAFNLQYQKRVGR